MKLRKNFDRCPHKDVKYSYGRDDVTYILGAVMTCPKTEETETPVAITANSMVYGTSRINRRRLTVSDHYYRPNFGGDYPPVEYTFKTPKAAQSWLGKVAAQTVCDGCTYAKSTPEEVSSMQFETLQTQLMKVQDAARNAQLRKEIIQAATAAESTLMELDGSLGINASLNLSPEAERNLS